MLPLITGESTVTCGYDAADQMVEAGGASYGYDDNGNQLSRGSDTFEWDPRNRLVATDIDSVEGTYAYNGDGLRTNRTIDAGNPAGCLAEASLLHALRTAAGLPQMLQDSDGNTYVYGLDLISVTDGGDDTVYFLCDGLGSTTGLADEAGDPIADYQYDVFGGVRDHTGPGSTEFTYTGEQNDATGLEYLRARYYDSATGRFLSRDPLGLPQAYPYAANNPVMLIDPFGWCPNGGQRVNIGPHPTPPSTPGPTATPPPPGSSAPALPGETTCVFTGPSQTALFPPLWSRTFDEGTRFLDWLYGGFEDTAGAIRSVLGNGDCVFAIIGTIDSGLGMVVAGAAGQPEFVYVFAVTGYLSYQDYLDTCPGAITVR